MPVERRSQSRHRINTPAYASILGHSGGVITDAHDNGIAIQGVTPLPAGSAVALRLDLLETRSIVEADARVTWSDQLGRSGLEFRNLSPEALGRIQQWLLVNALSLWATAPEGGSVAETNPAPGETKDEFRPAHALNQELAQAVSNALSATGAQGAALALITGTEAVCLASAGEIAPPVGSRLDSRNGISGACLRTGRLMRCDHADSDPRVDAETCRLLGISSVAAAPILIGGEVAGLVEIFSARPYAFDEEHCSTLQALAASVAIAVQANARTPEPPAAEPAPGPQVPASKEKMSVATEKEPAPVAASPIAAQSAPEPVREGDARPGSDASSNQASSVAEENSGERARRAATAVATAISSPNYEESVEEPVRVHPATLRSEFGVVPDAEAEIPGTRRNRLLLLAPIALLLLMGTAFLAVRGRMNPSRSQPAAPVVTATPQRPVTASRPTTGFNLADLRSGAERGDANAQFELGAKYASGDGVVQNYNEAVKWFNKAAESGHVLSAATLGAFYWAGRGVRQDYVSAYMWSEVAKQAGDEASKYRVAILGSRMTPDQVNEAQVRATEWLRQHPRFLQASNASSAPVQ